jgi:hypothetical protein
MDTLPEHCLDIIGNNLETMADKVNYKNACLRLYRLRIIPKEEKLVFILHDLITNIGSNYDITTQNYIESHSFHVSYLLNIYLNTAIFFQKVKTHSGIVIYVRLMTLDRHALKKENVEKIVKTLMVSTPIISRGIMHKKVVCFLNTINS